MKTNIKELFKLHKEKNKEKLQKILFTFTQQQEKNTKNAKLKANAMELFKIK